MPEAETTQSLQAKTTTAPALLTLCRGVVVNTPAIVRGLYDSDRCGLCAPTAARALRVKGCSACSGWHSRSMRVIGPPHSECEIRACRPHALFLRAGNQAPRFVSTLAPDSQALWRVNLTNAPGHVVALAYHVRPQRKARQKNMEPAWIGRHVLAAGREAVGYPARALLDLLPCTRKASARWISRFGGTEASVCRPGSNARAGRRIHRPVAFALQWRPTTTGFSDTLSDRLRKQPPGAASHSHRVSADYSAIW